MDERLTDEQLSDIAAGVMISDRVVDISDAMAIELLALRARVAKLEAELKGANLAADKLNKAYDAARVMLEDTR